MRYPAGAGEWLRLRKIRTGMLDGVRWSIVTRYVTLPVKCTGAACLTLSQLMEAQDLREMEAREP
jgi:hypothetical protein